MGIIIKEEYVCDFCGNPVEGAEKLMVGRLQLRKSGARGMSRNFEIVMHNLCADELTQFATPVKQLSLRPSGRGAVHQNGSPRTGTADAIRN